MRIIKKTEIKNSLLLESLAQLNNVKDKLNFYKAKYASEFKIFEKKVKKSSKEDFEYWDDYIEWKAYVNVFNELSDKIKDIERGNFRVA
ncbi:MAG: hypothetical protein HYU69_11515 [Bacteroidetes bacterium]|nr:hypothetical protein [Bacteroidota bacterium]